MKTIKVRIACVIDRTGQWYACGWNEGDPRTNADDAEMMGNAIECVEPGEARYFIEAEIPIPETNTIQGTVHPEK